MKISDLANDINNYCQEFKYFWAAGLIRESLKLWENPDHYQMLNDDAKCMVDKYLN